MLSLTRCARPTIGTRRWSTYTVMGFIGYVVASVFGAIAVSAWELGLAERLVALLAPPLAFLATVVIVIAVRGREVLVFYEGATAAVAVVVVLGTLIGGHVPRLLDVVVLGIGVAQAFGRIGCFHVACCHGRPARRGVVYGPQHVAVGFWPRWSGRTLFPIQLIESGVLFSLVGAGLMASSTPGAAALSFGIGYGLVRFVLELFRGDPVRPFAWGLSESQWFSVATVACCAIWRPTAGSLAALAALSIGAGLLIATRRGRELVSPPHLHELDHILSAIVGDPTRARRESRLGVAVSCHALDGGKLDWVMSATHASWSPEAARSIAAALWDDAEVIVGRTPGVVHLIAQDAAARRGVTALARSRA